MSEKMIAYLAGKMTGEPDLGRGQFAEKEKRLRDLGWLVINPACLPTDLPSEKYMPICMAMIDQADYIVLLPGWEDSEGARLEMKYAAKCGKGVTEYFILDYAERYFEKHPEELKEQHFDGAGKMEG